MGSILGERMNVTVGTRCFILSGTLLSCWVDIAVVCVCSHGVVGSKFIYGMERRVNFTACWLNFGFDCVSMMMIDPP